MQNVFEGIIWWVIVYFANYDIRMDFPSLTYITLRYPDVVKKQRNGGGCRHREVEWNWQNIQFNYTGIIKIHRLQHYVNCAIKQTETVCYLHFVTAFHNIWVKGDCVTSSVIYSETQLKSILVHFSLVIWHLMATILMIFLIINCPNFVKWF